MVGGPFFRSLGFGAPTQRLDNVVQPAQQVVIGQDIDHVGILALNDLQVELLTGIQGLRPVGPPVSAEDDHRLSGW